MKQDVDLVVFSLADSRLFDVADVAVPLPTLDFSADELSDMIDTLASREVLLDGLVSMRDGNVLAVAKVAADRGWRGLSLHAAQILQSKHLARQFFNRNLAEEVHTAVATTRIPPELSEKQFHEIMSQAFTPGGVVFKAERGSCKSYVVKIQDQSDFQVAWKAYLAAGDYRGGAFVVEQLVVGREVSVETAVVDGQPLAILITGYLPQYEGFVAESGHVAPADITPRQLEQIQTLSVCLRYPLADSAGNCGESGFSPRWSD